MKKMMALLLVLATVTVMWAQESFAGKSLLLNNANQQYLSRTFGVPDAAQTWTLSFWEKRGWAFSSGGRGVFEARSDANNRTEFYYGNGGNIFGWNVSGGGTNSEPYFAALRRDYSGWDHILIVKNGTTSFKYFLNGVEQPTLYNSGSLADFFINNNGVTHNIGLATANSYYLDSYLSDVVFLDGTAVTDASDFGKPDHRGVWVPKTINTTTLPFGNNGFYLDFSDANITATQALDSSGNNNHWDLQGTTPPTQSNDSPASNYCTLNPLFPNGQSQYVKEGNLLWESLYTGTGGWTSVFGNIAVKSGKYYWETYFEKRDNDTAIGIITEDHGYDGIGREIIIEHAGGYAFYTSGATYNNSNAIIGYGDSYVTPANGTICTALDLENGFIWWGKIVDGVRTWFGGASLSEIELGDGTHAAYFGLNDGRSFMPAYSQYYNLNFTTTKANFGASGFLVDPPTGFKALSTNNLSPPAIPDGGTAFKAVTYTSQTDNYDATTGVGLKDNGDGTWSYKGLGFQPDLVWIKGRSDGGNNSLFDSLRGDKALFSDLINPEQVSDGLFTSFDTDGFTLGDGVSAAYGDTNHSLHRQYVAWTWKAGGDPVSNSSGTITSSVSANTAAGFSIVSYTGSGANATVGHGLSEAPELMILKNRDTPALDWPVYHKDLTSNLNFLALNQTWNEQSNTTYWNNTAPTGSATGSVFNVGTAAFTNNSGDAMIAYCWHSVEGFSKIGSYTGNGNADGPFVYTGFKPAYLMIKDATSAYGWIIIDTARDLYNVAGDLLSANTSSVEAPNDQPLDILSNGFKLRSDNFSTNKSGDNFIYMAFAENPFSTAPIGTPPTLSDLSTSLDSISPGSNIQVQLSWTTDATTCTIDDGTNPPVTVDCATGTYDVTPTQTTIYTLTATSADGGVSTKTFTVTVVPYDYTTATHTIQNAVGIGTSVIPQSADPNTPTMLAVNGKIVAKEIEVTSTGWADYVFDEEHTLPSLESVEAFIKENKHLPEMPSAAELNSQGIAVSDMLTRQMQKIEELTLYVIDLKKENTDLKERFQSLQSENK